MTHRLVKSTNVYSVAHEGDKMEVRFKCAKCDGSGPDVPMMGEIVRPLAAHCLSCGGIGHGPTYEYEGVDAATFAKVSEADSVGSAFHLLIKGKFTTNKLP